MHKPILLLAACAAFFVPGAHAQDSTSQKLISPFQKGTWTIGTRLGMADLAATNSPSGTGLQYSVSLTPSLGYFVTSNLMVSAEVSGAFYGNSAYIYSGKVAGIGLNGRYYFGKALNAKSEVNKFRFYAEGGAHFLHGWQKTQQSDTLTERSSGYRIVLRGGAGFNYLISNNVAFESGLGYQRAIYGSSPVFSNGNLQLELGLRVFLNRKRK